MILGCMLAASLWFQAAQAAEIGVSAKGHASNPTWSRDGQYLAFEVNTFSGQIDLFVVKVQNGSAVGAPQQVKLPGASSAFASAGAIAVSPVWHPQGRLIFEGSLKGGTSRLYDWAPGGTSATELLSGTQITGDLTWPSVRGDGGSVVFVSDASGLGDLYAWDRNSNKVNQLLTSPFTESAPRHGAGDTLSYSRKNQGTEDLYLYAAGKSVPLAGGNGDQTRPAWAGSQVLFWSSERGTEHWDLVVSGGAGQKKTLAKDVRLPDRAGPAVTPDGLWVAYGLSDPERDDRILFTAVDGSRTVEIETGLVACGEPSITAAGGRWYLAFTALPSEGSDWRALHVIDITGKL